jgi:hypothetical protein
MHKVFREACSSLTRDDWLWCYRAHCMQAHTSKISVTFRSASVALEGVVLLSLPLLLIRSSVRDACLIR